jgi:hypothetical protein
MIFLTSFLKAGIPALLHPMSRRRSHVLPPSTSAIDPIHVIPGSEHPVILRLIASKSTGDEQRAVSSKDAAPAMPRNPELSPPAFDEHQSQHAAHDRMILERLLSGDTRTLATLMLAGHVPGPTVRQCLALMLLDWPESAAAVAAKPALNQQLWQLPFRLIAKSRPQKSGRRRGTEKAGPMLRGRSVNRLVEELGYDAAVARVNEAVSSLIAPCPKSRPEAG